MKPVIAKFLTSAADPKFFPPEGPPEFAFLGRSNVGKSSLINSLLGQKMAHVSSTPGRTRTINFFGIYAKLNQPHAESLLVDLPGYGYAKISKEISAEWPKFIEPYLQERETLALSIILIDSNIPAQPPDRHLIDFLRSVGRDFLVVATKADKLSGNKLRSALATLARDHGIDALLPYSAKTGDGRTERTHGRRPGDDYLYLRDLRRTEGRVPKRGKRDAHVALHRRAVGPVDGRVE